MYVEEFDGAQLDRRWSVYTGAPSSDPWTRWDPARVSVASGALVLGAQPRPGGSEHWTTGGVSNWRNTQTFGRWTIRYRATTSSVQSYHFLLWPKADTWPPEVDIAESWDVNRRRIDGFVHWRDASGARQRASAWTSGEFTGWNTVSVEWTPTALTYTLNGRQWARFTGAAVPHEPMWLALQTETQICDRATRDCSRDRSTPMPRVEIDRVVVESYVG